MRKAFLYYLSRKGKNAVGFLSGIRFTRNALDTGKTAYLEIALSPSGIHLGEVVVKPTKEKYRKKDNPAVRLVREIIDRKN